MSKSETVTILKERFEEMEANEQFLRALEAAGVDNWDGYEEAQDIFNGN